MQRRPLGRTGMQVSPLCLGAMMFETQLGAANVALSADVLDRIDEIVPPGVTLAESDRGYVPPSISEPALRRRR